jgi:hypothetical protein
MTKSKAAALLEKLSRMVPGIAGYQDRERRRDSDKAVRDNIAALLARCRQRVSERMNEISHAGGRGSLFAIGKLEGVNTLLEHIEDEVRYAPQGYAGWFDREGVSLEDLERLYEYDLFLLEMAGRIPDIVGPAADCDTEKSWVKDLRREIEAFREAFGNRTQAFKKEGDKR